jgi:hypothetical protein
MALGITASGPGGHFLRLIYSRDFDKYKFNQKARSIHIFTFRETQNPDRLDTFDFDKPTLKIITSARKHQTSQFFAKKLTIVMCNFTQNFRSIMQQQLYRHIHTVEKQKSYAILNDRLETFDRYCMLVYLPCN